MRTTSRAARNLVPPAVLTACAVALAACSSTPAHHVVPTTTTTTTTIPSPPTTSAPTSSGTSSSTGVTSCAASSLTGAVTGTQGGAGVLEVTVALHNVGGSTCTLHGYAGLQLIGAGGVQLTTSVHQGGPLSFESVAPSTVSLAAGQDAYFNIGFSDVPTGAATSCSTATSMQVVPPGDSGHVTVSVQIQPCGGALSESALFGAGSPAMQTTAPATGG